MTNQKKIVSYFIDFDSTFTRVEALEELAKISLKLDPNKENIIQQIGDLTKLSMEGKLDFSKSLSARIALLQANKKDLELLSKILKKKISISFSRNKLFFKNHSHQIYIISGGFREFILPVVKEFGIKPENVFANTFLYDKNDNIIGCDTKNPLCKEGGKVILIKKLKVKSDIYLIGDGYSDYQLKESNLVKKFFVFTENISRQAILEKSEHIAPSFDEFLYVQKLPMAISYPKNRIIVQVLGNLMEIGERIFKKEGYTIFGKIHKLSEISILWLDDKTNLNAKFLTRYTSLKAIGFNGNSKKNIDFSYCTSKGIIIFDDPKKSPNNSKFLPKRIIDYINKGSSFLSANFPNIDIPKVENANRLLHIHQNVPGILARINFIFAKHNINIVAQYLKTNSAIGYVITDIEGDYNREIIHELKKIEHTIKFRILY